MLEELNAIMCHSAEMVTCLWHPTVTLETYAIVSADHFGFRWTGENIKTNEFLKHGVVVQGHSRCRPGVGW